MKDIFLFVGLGNIGNEYANTHHNMGFWAIDEYANHLGVDFNKTKCNGMIAEYTTKDSKVLLVKPTTYMNKSGECVVPLVQKYKIPLNHICIIYDDMDLDVGVLRMRKAGKPGSHNGIKNVTELLGTENFARIRIGIGKCTHGTIVDFVLSKVSDDDKEKIVAQLPRINVALDKFIKNGGDVEKIQI